MSGHKTAPGYLRADLQASLRKKNLDPGQLSVFQRILLTTDGMVTEMLEAYLGEKMVVTRLAQTVSDEPVSPELRVGADDQVWTRAILLQGDQSGRVCLYARSSIVANRLPAQVRRGLEAGRKPIGQLLLESRVESYREILACDLEPAGELAEYFGISPDDQLLSRSYLVSAEHRPVMLIEEKFPRDAFRD